MGMSVWVAGRYHVDWPGVCKYHGWDPKTLCGPVIMAGNQDNAEVNCPWGHSAGCAHHKLQKVKGKPYALRDFSLYESKGLCQVREELIAERNAGKHPPGTSKQVGVTNVYPARHFGRPTGA